ncbi:DNA polymerase Y family protein [Haladaptatus caseinilyticus]|uniref:DNA polymerase Y family protein n=1 Tax=Haladaptatus caseinilyticus TaxID=2993314 RepID=UPI00224A83D2|nr:DNA polymerase IV [Haladaptatus caseinilyticus]
MPNRGGSRLPGVEGESEERIVFHVDMDCFYAACERLREPQLEGVPVVVGMGYEDGESHGAVATASYEAREHGVESAQAIGKALERLPRKAAENHSESDTGTSDPDAEDRPAAVGYYRPVDIEFYKSVSEDVRAILHDCADTVREVSIDEAYLDVTDRTAWKVAEGFARHVKNRIEREVGVPASVGVAPNMSTAKIASDYDKPNGLVVVEPGTVRDFLAPLDVSEIHGVGPVTARDLHEMDIETAGDLAEADPRALADRFGERGRELYHRARGDDDREVTPTGRPKSLSRESAFTGATSASTEKRSRVKTLATAVAERARDRNAMYRTIGVKVVTPPFDVHTRERSLPGPVDDRELVSEIALDLLSEFADERVRKVGVRVSNLQFTEIDQTSLDGFDAPKSTVSEPEDTDPEEGTKLNGEKQDEDNREADRRSETEETRTSRSGQVSLSDF